MKLKQCVEAYTAILELIEKEWSYQTAHALVTLKRELKPHVDFYAQEEMRLVEKFAAKDEKGNILWTGNGTFSFMEKSMALEYAKQRETLGNVEVQEDFRKIKAPAPERIKPSQLDALIGFIEFESGEGDEKK